MRDENAAPTVKTAMATVVIMKPFEDLNSNPHGGFSLSRRSHESGLHLVMEMDLAMELQLSSRRCTLGMTSISREPRSDKGPEGLKVMRSEV